MADGTPRHVTHGGKRTNVTEFVNPFDTPSREGFAVFIKNVTLAYVNGGSEVLSGLKKVMSPYGEKLAAISGKLVAIDYRYSLELDDIFSETCEFIESDEDKILFQQAVGDVLLGIVNDQEGLSDQGLATAEMLMGVIRRINAFEVVNVLVNVMSEKSLIGKTDEQKRGITTHAMNALLLFKDSQKVTDTIAEFVDSSDFPADYIFRATANLLRRDPSRANDVVEKYTARFVQTRDDAKEKGGRLWNNLVKPDMKEWMEAVIEANPSAEILEKTRVIVNG